MAGPDPSLTGLRLALFYGASFAVLGIMLPFWPVWLASRGLDPSEIGLVLALLTAIRIVATPAVAHYADRIGERRRVIVWLSAISAVAFAMFFLTRDFWPILIITALFSSTRAGVMPLGESLTMLCAHERGLDYGRLRLWGSLSFMAAAAATGWLLTGRPEDLVFWLVLGALVFSLGSCLALPEARPGKASRGRAPLIRVLKTKSFVLFLAAAALVQGGHAVYYAFGTLSWRAAGHSDTVIGLLWAEGVIAEVALFAVGARLLKVITPAGLIALGGAAGALRWAVTGADPDLPVLIVMQLLHAFTFGAAHLGAIHFVARAVPTAESATAQSLYAAASIGAGLGLAMLISGPLYDAFGGGAYYAMAFLSAMGGALGLLLGRRERVSAS
jgi:PPP family 3-phenylpropionic acid transporter